MGSVKIKCDLLNWMCFCLNGWLVSNWLGDFKLLFGFPLVGRRKIGWFVSKSVGNVFWVGGIKLGGWCHIRWQ